MGVFVNKTILGNLLIHILNISFILTCVNVGNHVGKQNSLKSCFHTDSQFCSPQYFQNAVKIYGHYSTS